MLHHRQVSLNFLPMNARQADMNDLDFGDAARRYSKRLRGQMYIQHRRGCGSIDINTDDHAREWVSQWASRIPPTLSFAGRR